MAKQNEAAPAASLGRQRLELGNFQEGVEARLAALNEAGFGRRLWGKDPSLWTEAPSRQEEIKNSLGWLDVAGAMTANLDLLQMLAHEARATGFVRVVHMGMGGSSLAPLVMGLILPAGGRGLPLTVLDTTDPATVLKVDQAEPLENTLFIVASKSGTTAEPHAFHQYFYHALSRIKGNRAGENFIAITDPETPLAKSAKEDGFRHIFLNFPDIGGRYSALSFFGMVPAALAGFDTGRLLDRALAMESACGGEAAAPENPGLVLGAVLGELGRHGRDKITFLAEDKIAPLAMWLEQLLAESTGKEGKGLLPVAGEELAEPGVYGSDRLFVHLRLGAGDSLDQGVGKLKDAGQPVVTIDLNDPYDLGQEFFRWEIATATAGAIIGINPFDQPNVQESKDNTNLLLAQVDRSGELPAESPLIVEEPLSLYHEAFIPAAGSITDALNRFLSQARPGDYLALMAYLTESEGAGRQLAQIRSRAGQRLRLATTLGYGPRFLHSTGQFHKGGPNSGLFLQLTCDDTRDVQIPGAGYGFSTFKQAQALGDLEALRRHGRRVARLHLGADIGRGLARLAEILEKTTPEF
ncbi:MAG: hypothetical protein M1309_05610 [Actinobacteria bacterium]|nr:hypothetical protein [Actinomycetota bacterium]